MFQLFEMNVVALQMASPAFSYLFTYYSRDYFCFTSFERFFEFNEVCVSVVIAGETPVAGLVGVIPLRFDPLVCVPSPGASVTSSSLSVSSPPELTHNKDDNDCDVLGA